MTQTDHVKMASHLKGKFIEHTAIATYQFAADQTRNVTLDLAATLGLCTSMFVVDATITRKRKPRHWKALRVILSLFFSITVCYFRLARNVRYSNIPIAPTSQSKNDIDETAQSV